MTIATRHQVSANTEAEARLRIELIGGLRVFFGLESVTIKKQKAAALLVLLAIAPDLRLTRDHLRGTLWPESDEHAAQTSLRNAIWALKAALEEKGCRALKSDRSQVWLEPGQTEVDVTQLIAKLDMGDMGVLSDINPQSLSRLDQDQPAINDVITAQLRSASTQIARQVRHRLDKIVERASSQEDTLTCLQFAANMNAADEGAARALINAYWKNGQVANALAAYQSLWNLLDEEYGQEPSAETQDLIVEIKASDYSVPIEEIRPRIIVAEMRTDHLPPDLASLAQLSREALCSNLARFREWRVFDATLMAEDALSTQEGKSYTLSLHTNATDQGLVCHALLADRTTGELLWSERINDPSPQMRQNQAGAADRLAVALNLHLSAYLSWQSPKVQAEPSVYERWVEAHGLSMQFTLESWKKAEVLLDALIRDYPDFSRGHSSRAAIENMRQISFPGVYSVPEMHVKGLQYARRAIELDPMDSRGQLAMGWSAAMSRQFDRAELAFDLAFQYNQNDPWTITSAAVGLAFCDRYDAASRLLDLLFKLNFQLEASHWSYVAASRFLGGDYAGCVLASENSDEISHDVPAWHAAALALTGRLEEAAQVAERFEQIARENWVANTPVERSEITRWLISGFPIRNRDTWLKLRDGLRLAGMPVPSLVESDAEALGYQLENDAE